ncbi:Uu.00g035120.m01.CDS01 [Anthostomella pinea]|uniref:Uu.00g035120.m01.CDS01 n=1 Tax=Anthostomella pinea TaxID=933095 RepID=A0AAI8V971_9PEZI|nr:Uu.00g035120.m01.CDS01 [Anthostomella pinea]
MLSSYFVLIAGLLSAIGNCAQPTIVYRGDTKTPKHLKDADGFKAKGGDQSLYSHVSKGGQDNDGYVSTSANRAQAVSFAEKKGGGDGYVYEISANKQFIDCAGTLKQYYDQWKVEEEFSAIGGIEWKQIKSWTVIENFQEGDTTQNPDYDVSTENEEAGGAQPQLAGFPTKGKIGKAWNKDPWKEFADCKPNDKKLRRGDCNDDNDSADGCDDVCKPKKSNKDFIKEYLDSIKKRGLRFARAYFS